jgi:hypothetical protein
VGQQCPTPAPINGVLEMPTTELEYPNQFTFDQSSAWDLLCLSEAVEAATLCEREKDFPFINKWREAHGSMELRDYLITISHIPRQLWDRYNTYDQMLDTFTCYDFEFVPWFLQLLEEHQLFGDRIEASFFDNEIIEAIQTHRLNKALSERCSTIARLLESKNKDGDHFTAMVDLLADLKIYADRNDIDFKTAMKSAKRHAKADQDITDRETIEGLAV